MSDTLISIKRKISGAGDLKSVVRTMKVLAASNIVQYEKAVIALNDFYHTIELGLFVCLRQMEEIKSEEEKWKEHNKKAIIVAFGSDQGLVGQFNDVVSDFIEKSTLFNKIEAKIWAVGERMLAKLQDAGWLNVSLLEVPNSIYTISPLIGKILIEYEFQRQEGEMPQLYLFYNKPKQRSVYEPALKQLLPLDEEWRMSVVNLKWPTKYIPEAMFEIRSTLRALIRNYLYVSIFKVCAESLTSENASRLAAMHRAEKNIDELLEDLSRTYHQLRQSSIDEELFDVISGSEAINL